MPQPLLKRLTTIGVAVETTPGTKVSVAASDAAMNCYDVEIQQEIEVQERECQGSFNRLTGSPAARGGKVTFKCDMGWDGLAHPLWATVLFKACGLKATGDVYNPVSEVPQEGNVKTCTISVYEDGLIKTIRGAMGNCKITGTAGQMGMLEFEMTGVWDSVVDGTLLDPTYPIDLPARFAGQDFTWQSVEQCVESVEFDFGNNVILRECSSKEEGFISALITDRYPKITCNPEAARVADDDYYNDFLVGTEGILSFGFDGPVGTGSNGNIVVSCPKAQILSLSEGERNKLAINEIEFGANKNAQTEDEEFSITFTDKT